MSYATAAIFEHTAEARAEAREIVAYFMKEHGRPPRNLPELEDGPNVDFFPIYRYAIIDAIRDAQGGTTMIIRAGFFQEEIDQLVSENPNASSGELEELYITLMHPPTYLPPGKTPTGRPKRPLRMTYTPETIQQSRMIFRKYVRYVPAPGDEE